MKGAQNGPADVLSHLHANALHVEPNVIIDFKELATAQENDTELVRLYFLQLLNIFDIMRMAHG